MKILTLNEGIRLPNDGIVRQAEYTALFSATQILAKAESDANAIREAAWAEVEEARSAAKSDAYQQGLAQFVDAAGQLRATESDMHEQMGRMVRSCLDALFEELPEEAMIQAAIRKVLPEIDADGELIFTVHPSKVAALDRALDYGGGLLLGTDRVVAIESNPGLSPTACVLLTGSNVIDISVEIMTDRLVDVLQQAWDDYASESDQSHEVAA